MALRNKAYALVEQVSAAAAVLERQTEDFAALPYSSSGFSASEPQRRNGESGAAFRGVASAPAQSTDEWVSF